MTDDWVDTGFRKADGPGEIEANTTRKQSAVIDRAESVGPEVERLAKYDRTVYAADHLTLPGFGESGEGCGEVRPVAVCETCGETEFGPHVCGNRGCPDCWGSWAKDSALTGAQTVQAFRLSQPADHHRQTGHFVYSPEDAPTTLSQLKRLRTEAADVAKEKGVRGGATVLHPWRVDASTKKVYREQEPDVGIWVWLRETFGESWREQVVWSPHVHVVGLMTPEMEPGDDRGDVWALIDTFGRLDGAGDRDSHNEVYGAFRYLLSHAAVPAPSTEESLMSRTWFGELHGSKFTPEEVVAEWKLRRLERTLEEVTNRILTDEEAEAYWEEKESLDVGECPSEECGGVLIDVMRVPEYFERAEPPPEVSERMQTCHDWRMGRIRPPPGLQNPTCEEDARKVIKELL